MDVNKLNTIRESRKSAGPNSRLEFPQTASPNEKFVKTQAAWNSNTIGTSFGKDASLKTKQARPSVVSDFRGLGGRQGEDPLASYSN